MRLILAMIWAGVLVGCSSQQTTVPELPTPFSRGDSGGAGISVVTEEAHATYDGADGGAYPLPSPSRNAGGQPTIEEDAGQKTNQDPEVSLTVVNPANPEQADVRIKFRGEAKLIWQSKDVRDCSIVAIGAAGQETPTEASGKSGEHLLKDIRETKTIRVDCIGAGGGTVSASGTVTILGRWYQAEEEECPEFCEDQGLINAPSLEGFMCTSGEAVAATAIGVIDFAEGCWPDRNCPAHANRRNTKSDRRECYGEGQSKDDDDTDKTMGCYCE